MKNSIRVRLTVWYGLALAAGLLLFALAIWISMWRTLRGDVERSLDARLANIEKFMRDEARDHKESLFEELTEYSQAFPEGTHVEIRSADGTRAFTSEPRFPWAAVHRGLDRSEVVWWSGHRYLAASRDITADGIRWHVTFLESLALVDNMLRRLRWLLLALLPVVVSSAAVGAAWLSRRALKPVDEITAAARTVGIQDLSARLPVPQTGDELQRLSETWNSMLARLEDAVSRLSRFTADASHELRTPLAVIRSTAEIAGRRPRTEKAYRAALAAIVQESERMAALVDDLLFLARCDADSLNLPMESFSLRDVIEDVFALLKPVAESKDVRLSADVDPGPLSIWGNRSAIRRLVLILADNAIKYCRAGGAVRIAARQSATEVRLSVDDEGFGITASELPLVFERFYRGARTRETGTQGGFGLGLALASGIAQQHRSRVEVVSTNEQGSTFEVALPVAPPA